MKLRTQNPPHIRSRESSLTMMADIVIATLPLYAMEMCIRDRYCSTNPRGRRGM